MKYPITAIQCHKCEDIIWSRNRHDFRWCSCVDKKGKPTGCAVDGGQDYLKITGNHGSFSVVEVWDLQVTKKKGKKK